MNARRISSETGTVGPAVYCAAVGMFVFFTARTSLGGEKVPTFEPVKVFPRPGEPTLVRPYGLASADFDDDNYPDVVVVERGIERAEIGAVTIFMNRGVDANGAWLEFDPPVKYSLGIETRPTEVAVGNLNPQVDPIGYPDIVVSAFSADQVFVFLNDGSGAFVQLAPVSLPSNFAPRGIAAGTFGNSVTTPCVAAASGLDDRVVFLDNNGFGVLSVPGNGVVTLGVFASAFDVVGGEFDASGAGNEDALTSDWAGSACDFPFLNDTMSVLRNEGNFAFDVTQSTGGCGDFPRSFGSIAKGRFQGTGDNDIVGSEECRAFLDVVLGDGLGGWTHSCSMDRYQVHPNSSVNLDGVATGHLNGGTKTDIVVAATTTNEVGVLLGRGDGTFQRPASDSAYLYSTHDTAFPDSVRPVQAIIVDLDQDGFGDIVVTDEDEPPPLRGALSVLINEMVVSIPPG